MKIETIYHAMLKRGVKPSILKTVLPEIEIFALKESIKGSFIFHKNECLIYTSSTIDTGLIKLLKEKEILSHFRRLHQGTSETSFPTKWTFCSEDVSLKPHISIGQLLSKIESCQNPTNGIKLFSSLAEIVLSETLYGLE